MKKKLSYFLLLIFITIFCAVSFSACDRSVALSIKEAKDYFWNKELSTDKSFKITTSELETFLGLYKVKLGLELTYLSGSKINIMKQSLL